MKTKTFYIDNTGRQVWPKEEPARDLPADEHDALECIAAMTRGLAPQYAASPAQPAQQNTYHLEQGEMFAYEQRLSMKNMNVMLKCRTRRV